MAAAGTPLAELLQALAPPLEYLAADDFRRLDQTRLPLRALAERLARARAAASPDVDATLDALDDILRALEEPSGDHTDLARRAHALLPSLRAAASAAPVTPAPAAPASAPAPAPVARWTDYRASTGNVEPALAVLGQTIAVVRSVGPKRATELQRFGLRTVEDVLYHLPFRYEDWRTRTSLAALRPGEDATAVGTIQSVRSGAVGKQGRRVLEVVLRDAGATLMLVFFNQAPYFASRFVAGQRLLVHGRVEPPMRTGPNRMVHPDLTPLVDDEPEHALPPVVPVYEKPTAMPVGALRRIVETAVETFADRVPAGLPPAVAARQRLLDPPRALRQVHTPPASADLVALTDMRSLAHRSLVFDELFFLQLGLALRRQAAGQEPGTAFPPSQRLAAALRAALPFQPTAAQERAVAEIDADLAQPHPMRRLLQGDVGSGKTLVALLAALTVIESGAQVALMAPTELLAEQHVDTVRPLLAPLGLTPVLLTGAVKGAARRAALQGIGDGSVALAIGTHALIQETVTFARLGLAIVDEQHRFGVMQRAALQRQAGDARALDVLVMSATPIPRTLALTLYGDLAVSTLDELPPGRTPIATRLCKESRRQEMAACIREQVAAGHQAYVVYPLVEESEKMALRSATTMVHELAAGPLAGLRLDLVHGRMKAEEKDAVMRRFKAREFDVLVSTTVIEVGIDVPNATAIVIEHAERFGLAQLHQLRGRVGRGSAPGHCFLMVPDWMPGETYQRMLVLERSTDGFRIAEADMALRGPGDFLGTRQAGLPPFRVANLVRDTELLRAARDEAAQVLADDPDLSRPESAVTRAVLRHRWQGRLELARVG